MCIDWANWQYVVTSWSRDTPEIRWYKAHYVCFQKINTPVNFYMQQVPGSGPEVDQKLTWSWLEVGRKLVWSRPEVDQKSPWSWPEVCQKLPGSRSEVVQKLVGSRANHVTSSLDDTSEVKWYKAHYMCFQKINTPSQLPHVAGARKWTISWPEVNLKLSRS